MDAWVVSSRNNFSGWTDLVKLLLIGNEMNLRLHRAAYLLELTVLHIDWLAKHPRLQVEVLVLVTLGIHWGHVLLMRDCLILGWIGAHAVMVVLKVVKEKLTLSFTLFPRTGGPVEFLFNSLLNAKTSGPKPPLSISTSIL